MGQFEPDKSLSFKEIQTYQADRITYMQHMATQFGNIFQLRMLWINLLVVNEPELVRELLVKRANQTERDPYSGRVFKRILGEGVLVAEGETWKRKRKLVQPAFHAMRIRNYTDVMAAYTREAVEAWQTGDELEIDKELTRITLRIIAKTMYNVDIAEVTETIGRNMAITTSIAEEQLGEPFILPKWIPTPRNRRQNQALALTHDLLGDIIRERAASGRDEGDLLSMLLQARDESDGSALTEQELLDECTTLFLAGHETTAALMTWVCYLLAQNPAVLEKLRAEVDGVLETQAVTFEALAQLPYTEWVIKEVLRLYPPAWSVGRIATEDFELGTRQVKKGTVLLVSPYVMQHSADFFPDPERFWPERWAAEQPHRYAYIPFGAGPRVCLGNMFAMLEARVILTTLVQHVDLELLSKNVVLDLQITLRPKDPLRMKVTKRESAGLQV